MKKPKPLKFIANEGTVYVEAKGLSNFWAGLMGFAIYTFDKRKTRWLLADDAITMMEDSYAATKKAKYRNAVRFIKDLQNQAKKGALK